MPSTTIPQFLLPRGLPSARTLRTLRQQSAVTAATSTTISLRPPHRVFSSSPTALAKSKKESKAPRVLSQPDKFRPPSHPQRRVNASRTSPSGEPFNYPGPQLSAKEREEQKHRQYPNMFPPEGTVMHKFLTSRWIHIWIALSILTSLAAFTFTTNFKRTSPFAHLLPPFSGLLSHPIDTISQALSVYRMHVEHNSMRVREQRHRRIEDAEKRRQFRLAHGLEEPSEKDKETTASSSADAAAATAQVDNQSPVAAADVSGTGGANGQRAAAEYVDWEGKQRPVKKWLGIW